MPASSLASCWQRLVLHVSSSVPSWFLSCALREEQVTENLEKSLRCSGVVAEMERDKIEEVKLNQGSQSQGCKATKE